MLLSSPIRSLSLTVYQIVNIGIAEVPAMSLRSFFFLSLMMTSLHLHRHLLGLHIESSRKWLTLGLQPARTGSQLSNYF